MMQESSDPIVVFQGVEGAFSDRAARNYLGSSYRYEGKKTFEEVFKSLKHQEADLAVLPIENSLIGSIYEVYDLLGSYDFQIIGEAFLRIEHYLMGVHAPGMTPSERIEMISQVLSHPKALLQCERFFHGHPKIQKVIFEDTAAAAKEIAGRQDLHLAAIASREAAEKYHLEILSSNIEDNAQNYTRFVVIHSNATPSPISDQGKATLMVTLKHQRGALLDLLRVFHALELNLTKIESRPLIGNPFEYIFYIDFEGENINWNWWNTHQSAFLQAAQSLKILGFYRPSSYQGAPYESI